MLKFFTAGRIWIVNVFNIYRLEKFILIVIAKIFSFVPYAIIILVHYGHLYLNEFE